MMLKVTIKFAALGCFLLISSCSAPQEPDPSAEKREADRIAEARIDSAYQAISDSCASRMIWLLPSMKTAVVKKDSVGLRKLLDTTLYHDRDPKVEKLIRQLKADCDSSLLKETYKLIRQQKAAVPLRSRRKRA